MDEVSKDIMNKILQKLNFAIITKSQCQCPLCLWLSRSVTLSNTGISTYTSSCKLNNLVVMYGSSEIIDKSIEKAVDYDDLFSFPIIDHRMPAQNMQ